MNRATLLLAATLLAPGCEKKMNEEAVAPAGAAPHFLSACPATFSELPPSLKEAGGTCACPLGVGSGAVWGTGLYTEDSAFCRAAVHAGAVDPAKGGAVQFKGAPGCPRYRGSAQHGVQTRAWKTFHASFFFPGHGEPSCAEALSDECPPTFTEIPDSERVSTFTCSCAEPGEGPVWGSGVYTRDSSICRAAVHAGAASPQGGKVTVRPAEGCPKYLASTRNGITTARWGPYAGSFYFEDYGKPGCPEVSADACPDTFLAIPDSTQVTKFSCTCSTDFEGGLWGTDIYTRDSSLCRAARHAGVVGETGGKIEVRAARACQRYEGSARNGVSSSSWGAYAAGSFVFNGRGEPACPQ